MPNSQARRPAPRPAAPRLHSGRAPALLRSPVARDASGPSRTGLNRRFAFGAGQLLAELLRPPRRGDAGPILGGLVLGIGAGLALERVAMLSETRLRPDPEADEPFGTLTGTPATVRSWDGTAIHVEELGQGPTLIFGHGFSMSGQAWHYQRRDLPEAFRCVFIDQRGHGASGRPSSGDYSLEAIARDIGAVIEWADGARAQPDRLTPVREGSVGREKVVLVMHSMSGMAALKLAELEPDLIARRVAGLVLVDTSYADNLRGMAAALGSRGASRVQLALYSAAYRMAGQDPPRALQLRRRGSDIGYLTTRLFGFGSNPSPSQVAFTDRLLAGTDVEVWAQVFPGLLDFDLEHVLETLPVPALVVAGDSDRLFPVSAATHMAGTIPDARLLILPDSGHMAFMEEHELLDSELAAFARRVMGLPQGPPHGLAAGAHG